MNPAGCPPARARCGPPVSPSLRREATQPIWSSLPPALAVLPEVAIARSEGRAFLTVAALLEPGADADALLRRIGGRLASLRQAPLTPADPHPSAAMRISGRYPPERYERIVSDAVERIRSSGVDKVVLARELTVEAPAAHDPGALLGALRDLFPSCFCFCFGTPEATFIGASPELLVRRSGAVAATVALAGTTSRSADPAVDDHLGEAMLRSPKVRDEHGIVVRRIERTLRPHSVWVHAEGEPFVVKVGNLQHLATPIRAQLAESHSAIELAGYLHPTPAIGGEPREPALELIDELEGIDRGWYTGPGRLDGRRGGRRVLRRPALGAAPGPRGAPVRRLRDRRRLRPGRRASGVGAQVRGAAAAASRRDPGGARGCGPGPCFDDHRARPRQRPVQLVGSRRGVTPSPNSSPAARRSSPHGVPSSASNSLLRDGLRLWQEVEDAPAAVVDHEQAQVRYRPRRRQAAEVMDQCEVAQDRPRSGPGRRRRPRPTSTRARRCHWRLDWR